MTTGQATVVVGTLLRCGVLLSATLARERARSYTAVLLVCTGKRR